MFRKATSFIIPRHSPNIFRACSTNAAVEKTEPTAKQIPVKMKAWQLDSFSGIESLKLKTDVDVPVIAQAEDVLIKVKAASINPLDLMMASGYGFSLFEAMRSGLSNSGEQFPLTLGRDFSGIVVDKGMNVTDYNVGDEVWGAVWPSSQGTHAEYVLANSLSISPKPSALNHTEAASLPYAALTAWSAIVLTGNLNSNSSPKKILVVGGSGGVGTFTVQLLKQWNHQVTAIASLASVPLLESLHADQVLDYTNSDFEANLRKCDPFDVILNFSGGKNEDLYLSRLKPGCKSKYVSTSSPLLNAMDKKGILFGTFESAMELINKNLSIIKDRSATYRWAYYTPNPSALKYIANLADKGKIVPVIDKVYPMANLNEAFKHQFSGGVKGKVVVQI